MKTKISMFSISSYKNASYIKPEKEFEPGTVLLENSSRVSKAILVGTVVSRFDSEKVSKIKIDDFTGTTELLAFSEDKKKLAKFKEGDIVWAICKAKANEEETFFVVEFAKKIGFGSELLWRTKRIAFLLKNSSSNNVSRETKKNDFEEQGFTTADKLKPKIDRKTI